MDHNQRIDEENGEITLDNAAEEAEQPRNEAGGTGDEVSDPGLTTDNTGDDTGDDKETITTPENGRTEVGGSENESAEEQIARLESALAAAEARNAELYDRLQRSAAEYQNARRRQEKQLYESIGRATEQLIRQILPVLDDFELAFKNLPDALDREEAAWVDGFERVQQKLLSALADEGVSRLADTGTFDPNQHEAISSEPSDEVASGEIIETLRTGYQFKERILRPAIVRVAE